MRTKARKHCTSWPLCKETWPGAEHVRMPTCAVDIAHAEWGWLPCLARWCAGSAGGALECACMSIEICPGIGLSVNCTECNTVRIS